MLYISLMAISLPVFYLQHRNRAKIQIHLRFWNFLLRFPISLFLQRIFSVCSYVPHLTKQPFLFNLPWLLPATQTPPAFALAAPQRLQERDVTRQLSQGFLQAPVLPCCRSWCSKLPPVDVPPWKEVTSLLSWVRQEAEEDSVVLKGQNLPSEHPFRKLSRS